MVRDLRVGRETAGTRELVSRVARGLAGRVYRRERYLVIEQRIDELIEARVPEGVRVSAFADEWDAVAPLLTSAVRRQFELRARSGRACLLAWRGDRVIGYTWMSTRIDPSIEGLPLALPDSAAYLWDLFVIRRERSAGIGTALTGARLAWTREAGFDLGWRAISPSNRPSARTAEKTGAVRVLGEIQALTRFGNSTYREQPFENRPLLTV